MSNSNSPNNPPTPPNNPNDPFYKIRKAVEDFITFITHDKLANFVQVLPFLLGLIIFISPLALLLKNWYEQTVGVQDNYNKFKTRVCENSKTLVEDRLKIEKNEGGKITVGKTSVVDKKTDINNQLPFSCEYTLLQNNKSAGYREIILEFNPVFSDLMTTVDNTREERIDMKEVCRSQEIIKQMKEKSKNEFNEKNGDKIIPGEPILDENKKDVYPVFQWVCSYRIQRKPGIDSGFQQGNSYMIDLNLDPYCQKRADEDGTKRIKPTHHYYNDPYSLSCADPHSKRKNR